MSWKRQQGEGGNHSGYIPNSVTNPWSSLEKRRNHSVPLWEKQFCMRAGSIPWGKLVETKKYMPSLYENIVQWNDSAGEEAFNNAKSRFWAELNGLPCNISLPDPDAYIDDVDWSSSKENVHENFWEPACGHQSKAAAMGGGWGSNTCNKWNNNYSRKTNYYGRGDHGVSWGNFKSDVNGGSWCQNQSRYKISRFVGGDSNQKAGGSWRKEEQSSRW